MNVMDYENSKRFRRNKLEEDDNISDNEWKTKNGMKDLELKNSFHLTKNFQNTMKIILHQRVFQDGTIYKNIITTEKYHYQFNYQKKIKKQPKQHPLKWAKFTDETEIESTMVVIGKIPLTRKRNVTNESQSAASNEVIIEGTKKKRNYAFTTYKNKSKKNY